jgi:hypothetical protein
MDDFVVPPPPPQQVSSQAPNPRRRLYIGLGIAAGVILLAGFVVIAVFGVKTVAGAFQEPAKALSLYTDALIRKDYQGAYNSASPGLRSATSFADLVAYHDKLTNAHGALKSVKQANWHVQTENGVTSSTIQATLQFDRDSMGFEFVLRKEGGVWRVYSYVPLEKAGVGEN